MGQQVPIGERGSGYSLVLGQQVQVGVKRKRVQFGIMGPQVPIGVKGKRVLFGTGASGASLGKG
jgi:hypothetical protein